jgi:cell division transport system permease protein
MTAGLEAWLARHAQTLLGSLGRMVRHPVATAMTVAVIAVALALPLFFNVLLQNTRTATANWNQAFELSVYMTPKTGTERAEALAKQIRGRPDVAAVRVITADQALAEFRNSSGFGKALPNTLIVTPTLAASTSQATVALRTGIEAAADVDTVQLDTEWVQRLNAMLDVMRRVLWLTGGLLGLSVVLVVGNTIRLDILNRREEIEVMKLVGATDGFARRPFLYSGVWYGLGGGIGAVIVVAIAVALLSRPLGHLALLYGSQFHLTGLRFGSVVRILGMSVALGWLGSWIAATRHIRAIDP